MKKITNTKQQLLIYTDLDGTLLNHHDYSYMDALPAINQLKSLCIPIIPVTSKTLVEVIVLIKELELVHPIIAENGSIIAFPEGYFKTQSNYSSIRKLGNYFVKQVSDSYESILCALHKIRAETGVTFKGFSDMSVDEVSHHTGLSPTDSSNSKLRSGSEPILWLGTESERLEFASALQLAGLELVKGGRFWHVMGNASKGKAIKIVNQLYFESYYKSVWTIGLGDSPNDIPMLDVVDVPVIVRSVNNEFEYAENRDKYLATQLEGPKGWCQFMLEYLSSYNRHDFKNVNGDVQEMRRGENG